jgi:hypothetical protein
MEISGYITLLASMIISRIINERGYRLLSDEEKVRLMDGFSKTRAYSLIPLFLLIGGYSVLMTKTNLDKSVISIGFFSLLIAFILIRSVMNHKKMKRLDMPDSYRRMFNISQIVSFIGIAWFFYALLGAKVQNSSAKSTSINKDAEQAASSNH